MITTEEFDAKFAEGLAEEIVSAPDSAGKNGKNGHHADGNPERRGVWTRMSGVERTTVEPLWPGYLYRGKLNLIGGDPGAGKSNLTVALVAHATRGWAWPDGSACAGPMTCILVCGEDDKGDSIGPRLDAVDADSSLVLHWDGMSTEEGGQRRPSLAKTLDITELGRTIKEQGAGLVIIDPLNPFLDDKTDTNRGNAVRAVTTPLADLATATGAAIVVVMHLNKSELQGALYRVAGSVDFIAAARSALVVGYDPESEDKRRLILSLKNNLGEQPAGQAFFVKGPDPGHLEWDRTPVAINPQQMLSAHPAHDAAAKREKGAALLRAILANGPQFAAFVKGITSAADVGWRTVEQAKSDLGVTVSRVPTPERKTRWTWRLPAGTAADPRVPQEGDDDGMATEDEEGLETETDAQAPDLCGLAALTGSVAEPCPARPLGSASGHALGVETAQDAPHAIVPVKAARPQRSGAGAEAAARAPCAGGCGRLTPHGWTCKACATAR